MIGIIPFSGFWAKDELLVVIEHEQSVLLYIGVLATLTITGLYMTRLYIRTFLGESRNEEAAHHAHDAEPLMTLPLILLAIPSVISGFIVFDAVGEAIGMPGGFAEFVYAHEPEEFKFHVDTAILSTVLAGGGIVIGWFIWSGDAEPAKRLGVNLPPDLPAALQPLLHRRPLPVDHQPRRARRSARSSPGSTATS